MVEIEIQCLKGHKNMDEAKTEELILAAARTIFVRKGKEGARMQEIANEAGVNKMLLHYYFRNKEQLFRRVVEDIVKQLIISVVRISVQADTFREFLETFIDRHIDFLKSNQDIFYFLLWEIRKDETIAKDIIMETFMSMGGTPFDYITEKINDAVEAGEIRPMHAPDFALSLASLDIFPFFVMPLFSSVGRLNESQVEELLERRKQEVFRVLWNDIKR